MRYLHHTRRGIFLFEANTGGGSGGAAAASGASGGGQGGGGQSSDLDVTLFEKLPWDELDDDTKATLNKLKAGSVATLQRAQTAEQKAAEADKLARKFQSDLDKSKKTAAAADKKNEPDPYVEVITQELRQAGYGDESEKLAPVFANMFQKVGALQRTEIGASLQPMAQTVLAGQAQDAYVMAAQNDPMGMLQIPEVASQVWDIVRQRVANNESNTPEIVLNLAKMAWVDHEAAKRAGGNGNNNPPPNGGAGGGNMILPATPPNFGMHTGGVGGFGAFGGGHMPFGGVRQVDPNAAKTVLNDDTKAALAASFRTMLQGPGMEKLKPEILKVTTR